MSVYDIVRCLNLSEKIPSFTGNFHKRDMISQISDDAFSWNENSRFTPTLYLLPEVSLCVPSIRVRLWPGVTLQFGSIKNHTSHSDVQIDSPHKDSAYMNRYFLNSG